MAYIKVEPTGCCLNKGWIQVRLSFFLAPTDPRYSDHHVYVVDEASAEFKVGYKGKVDAMGQPLDWTDYQKWVDGLPHIWRDNPFHNHFLMVDGSITNTELLKQAQAAFTEFYAAWCKGQDLCEFWRAKRVPAKAAKVLTDAERLAAEKRLAEIKVL